MMSKNGTESAFTWEERHVFKRSANPLLSGLVDHEQSTPDYSHGIPVAREKRTGELVRIRFDGETRIGFFAPSGKGKTTFGKAMLSRVYDAGFKVFNGGDIKNDFQSLDYKGGASKQLVEKMGLAQYEQPHPIPKKIFMPKFMADAYDGGVPSYVVPFTLGFQDVTWTDLRFLLQPDSSAQKEVFDTLERELPIARLADTEKRVHGFDLLRQQIDEKDLEQGLKRSINRTIDAVDAQHILSNRYRKDPLQYLNRVGCPECSTTEFSSGYDGVLECVSSNCDWRGAGEDRVRFAISLGLETWRSFQHGDMHKIQFYAAVLLRQLKQRVQDEQIPPPVVGFWDEAHLLLPAKKQSLLLDPMQDLLDVAARQMEMPIILSSQQPNKIPHADENDVLGELNHLFLGYDLQKKHWTAALEPLSLYRHYDKDKWRAKMNRLKKYDFLYVSPVKHRDPQDCPIVRSLAPLCAHTG